MRTVLWFMFRVLVCPSDTGVFLLHALTQAQLKFKFSK